MKNPLLDFEFLQRLDVNRNRTVYAKIISLNQHEHPIESIEGVVTAGSISIDGESAVRRICQLTLSAKNLNINNVYWGLTTKVKIEIGLQNTISLDYPEIIWFKQGIFILTDFKTSQTINNYTINLTGKDKMCLLNGDIAGNFSGPIRFDTYAEAPESSFDFTKEKHEFNLFEQQIIDSNILNEDYLNSGSSYRYAQQLTTITGLRMDITEEDLPNAQITFSSSPREQDWISIKDIAIQIEDENTEYLLDLNNQTLMGFQIRGMTNPGRITWTLEYKIPITILLTNLIHQWGQERFANIIIKDIDPWALQMVNSYAEDDYFLLYTTNVDKTYQLVSYSELLNNYCLQDGSAIPDDLANFIFVNSTDEDNFGLIDSESVYTLIYSKDDLSIPYAVFPIFSGEVAGYQMTPLVYPEDLIASVGESITSILDKIVKCLGNYEYFYNLDGQFVFQAKPAYIETPWNNTILLKDDNYIDPGELSKRIGYIFDNADLTTSYNNTPNMNNVKNDYIVWGERKGASGATIALHARYAIDNPPIEYTDFNGYTWCAKETQLNLTGTNENGNNRQYALPHVVDWRHLIYIMGQDWLLHNHEDNFDVEIRTRNNWPQLDINLFPYGKTGYEQYYEDLIGFWEELYDINTIMAEYNTYTGQTMAIPTIINTIDYYTTADNSPYLYWNKQVIEEPTLLNFWFDFFKADEMGIGKFAVSVIGDRPKTINNSIIKVITYRDAPDVIYCSADEYEWYTNLCAIKPGYKYIILDNQDFLNGLARSLRGRSAHQEIENMLYQYSYYNDNININTIPIYYLNPNTLISVKDELSNIIGYYVITKINLSLAYNGTMTINAIKTPERIY